MFNPRTIVNTDAYIAFMECTGILDKVPISAHKSDLYGRDNMYRQFSTLQLNLGQRSGKTTAIDTIAARLVQQYKLHLIIRQTFPNETTENGLNIVNPSRYSQAVNYLHTESRKRAIHNPDLPSYVTVFIDEPRFCFPSSKELQYFYEALEKLPISYVFMLGE